LVALHDNRRSLSQRKIDSERGSTVGNEGAAKQHVHPANVTPWRHRIADPESCLAKSKRHDTTRTLPVMRRDASSLEKLANRGEVNFGTISSRPFFETVGSFIC